jgi:hypothetical protein
MNYEKTKELLSKPFKKPTLKDIKARASRLADDIGAGFKELPPLMQRHWIAEASQVVIDLRGLKIN